MGEDSFDIGEGRTTDSARVRARDIPIVFAGDLNARPDEPAVRYLKTLGFASAYERVLGSEPAFTTWKIRTGRGDRRRRGASLGTRRGREGASLRGAPVRPPNAPRGPPAAAQTS